MDKLLTMTYASSLTKLCEVNSSFDTGVLKICYPGKNKNGSFIAKKTILKEIPTIYNCPIVCNYDRETDSLGGHDLEVVRDKDDCLRLVNLTTPVGVVPESANVWFEDVEEEDGTIKEYLFTDVLLWKRQEAYKKIKDNGITSHSMEIKVKDGEFIDGVYYINDFEFNAFALIGVTPCFESSSLEVFAQDDFKKQLSEMMQDLKETFSNTESLSIDEEADINTQKKSMEGGKGILEEKMNLAAEYNIDIESLDFSLEDFSLEELKEKFEFLNNKTDSGETEVKFELTQNLIDEIVRTLCTDKIPCPWDKERMVPRYDYVDCDIELTEVYCWDKTDWLLYGFNFTVDGDNITIDYESKKRKKFTIVDFDEGEQGSPIAPIINQFEEQLTDYADTKEKFSKASDEIKALEEKVFELEQFKAETEKAIAENERNEVFAKFEDLVGIDAFEELRSNSSGYEPNALEEKCFAIRGRNASLLKFSENTKNPKLKIEKPNTSSEPYGGIVTKYANTGSN